MLHDAVLVVERGMVVDVSEGGPCDVDRRGYAAAPGLVDTHTHGCCGVDFTSVRSPADVAKLARGYVKFGVTAFLPTTVSASHGRLIAVLEAVKGLAGAQTGGAKILGVNLEGPYINPRRRGAQDPAAIRPPDIREAEEYLSYGGLLKVMTLAPEMPGALELIKALARAEVAPSVGHTDADYATTRRAIALGASRATHLFNAMRGFHHREPGAVWALLEAEDVYLELILDLVHLRPEAVSAVLKVAGSGRVVLITDSIAAAGLGEGDFRLGDIAVHVEGKKATLDDGTLAGSVLTLDEAVRNAISIGVEPRLALAMASRTPALSIGEARLGCLKPGCRADFVILDGKFNVIETYIDGERKWSILKSEAS